MRKFGPPFAAGQLDRRSLRSHCEPDRIEVDDIGRAPVKCDMRISDAEESGVISEFAARLADGVMGAQANIFIFSRAPLPFHQDVVAQAAATVPADADLVRAKSHTKLGTGTVSVLIRAKNIKISPARPRFSWRVDAEVGYNSTGKRPREHPTSEQFDNDHDVWEAASRRNVGRISRPKLGRPIDSQAAHLMPANGRSIWSSLILRILRRNRSEVCAGSNASSSVRGR